MRPSLPFSPRGEAKVRERAVRTRREPSRLARAGVLEQYVEHGKQAQRSPGGSHRVLRPSGGETCRLEKPQAATNSFFTNHYPLPFDTKHGFFCGSFGARWY